MFDSALLHQTEALLEACHARGVLLAAAESCTGGMIGALLTAIPGCSGVLDCGFITYSNRAKENILGVRAPLIDSHGAVSEAVAKAMAEGALQHSQAHLAVAVTGIAGPDGGSEEKPVGTVWIAVARNSVPPQEGNTVKSFHFSGNRAMIRHATVVEAIRMLHQAVES